MARRRMIDPNFWQSEDVSRLSKFSRLLLLGMISNADDEGRGRASANYLKSIIFPYDEIRTAEVDKALSEIAHNISVDLYQVARSQYYAFTNWEKWQRVDKPLASIFPPPPEDSGLTLDQLQNDSGVTPEQLQSDSVLKEKKRKEEKRKEELRKNKIAFDTFWEAYPRKIGKESARKAFAKVPEDFYALLIPALEQQKSLPQWQESGGKYIPYPATWLNGKRWEDFCETQESMSCKQGRLVQKQDDNGEWYGEWIDDDYTGQ